MGLNVDAFTERIVSGEIVEETAVIDAPLISKGINDHRTMAPAGGVQVTHSCRSCSPSRWC